MYRAFSRASYLAGAAIAAVSAFLFICWAPSAFLVGNILTDSSLAFSEALRITVRLLIAVVGDMPIGELVYAATLAALVGVNIALLVFYFKMFRAAPSVLNIGSGMLGAFSALLGFGCTACGAVFATALFATIGGTGLLAALPFHGTEFSVLALLFLAFSIYTLSRAINKPPVCPI